ncbi:MAG: hypothetical protein LBB38_01195 [Puniceicoccales bacterium]|jgi:hypothetical protein|nr:hypothetical protein [Puniceicoccales bacterium]
MSVVFTDSRRRFPYYPVVDFESVGARLLVTTSCGGYSFFGIVFTKDERDAADGARATKKEFKRLQKDLDLPDQFGVALVTDNPTPKHAVKMFIYAVGQIVAGARTIIMSPLESLLLSMLES